jgi:hypothetical protein
MSAMFSLIFKTVIGRWVTASLVALLLGIAVVKWHNFKEGLIHQGQQVCVQEINKQTLIDLQDALAAEKIAHAKVVAMALAAAEENEKARARQRELLSRNAALEKERAEQRKNDETYKAWADGPLPTGVGERMRRQAAGSNSDPV